MNEYPTGSGIKTFIWIGNLLSENYLRFPQLCMLSLLSTD